MTRNTLVLGASSDIARDIIRVIDRPDRRVAAHYHTSIAALEKLSAELQCELTPLRADLATEDGCRRLIAQADPIMEVPDDIVFLPAPPLTLTRFKSLKWQDFQKHLNLQVGAAVELLTHYLPKMSKRQSGKVVFVSSIYTLGVPPAAMAHYTTAKYAQIGLMKSLASEYATRSLNINAVSPSMVETSFLSTIPEKLVEFSAEKHPLKRNATPSDVAPAVAFLLSDAANYINGVNLPVAGGAVF